MKIIGSPQMFFFLLLLTLATSTRAQEVEDESKFNYIEGSDKGPKNWENIKPEWLAYNTDTIQPLIELPPRIVERDTESEIISSSYQPGQTTIKSKGHDIKSQVIWQFGPYGSQLPENYRFRLGGGERFKEVIIRHGGVVDGIGFVVARANGGVSTKYFGSQGGGVSRISLRDGEYITHFSGTFGNYRHTNNRVVIGTLKIHTNWNRAGYGPYGQGRPQSNVRAFTTPQKVNRPVVGVFGKYSNVLESIGVFIRISD